MTRKEKIALIEKALNELYKQNKDIIIKLPPLMKGGQQAYLRADSYNESGWMTSDGSCTYEGEEEEIEKVDWSELK